MARTRALKNGEMILHSGGNVDDIHLITVRHQPTKIEETNDGRTRTRVNDGPEVVHELEVRVQINARAIAESLGRRAFYSKRHKTAFMGGLVVVTVEKIR